MTARLVATVVLFVLLPESVLHLPSFFLLLRPSEVSLGPSTGAGIVGAYLSAEGDTGGESGEELPGRQWHHLSCYSY